MLYKTGSDDDIVREDKCEIESSYKPSREDILDRFCNDPLSELLDNVLDGQNCLQWAMFPMQILNVCGDNMQGMPLTRYSSERETQTGEESHQRDDLCPDT